MFKPSARLFRCALLLLLLPVSLPALAVEPAKKPKPSGWGVRQVLAPEVGQPRVLLVVVLAPGLREFGEDPAIDLLIRKYGYRGKAAVLKAVEANEELRINLSAAAHLIHGSAEGRFSVTYCPGYLTRQEIESVGFRYGDLAEAMREYAPASLAYGWNERPSGERFFYIPNPAIGLWASADRI